LRRCVSCALAGSEEPTVCASTPIKSTHPAQHINVRANDIGFIGGRQFSRAKLTEIGSYTGTTLRASEINGLWKHCRIVLVNQCFRFWYVYLKDINNR
jgi:hypothetical protein